jgi:hypothetical protein
MGVRYNMGTSQNYPVHIPTFLQQNHGDPAVRVSGLAIFYRMPFHTFHTELLSETQRSSSSPYPSGASAGGCIPSRTQYASQHALPYLE